MHDLTDGNLRLPCDAEKLRCASCGRTLLVVSGPDIQIRLERGFQPAFVLVSANSLVISCACCRAVNLYQNGELTGYPS